MLKKIEPPPNAVRRIADLFGTWHQRVRWRRQLLELSRIDDHMLKDIGVSRSELLCEASKPFWHPVGTPADGARPFALNQNRPFRDGHHIGRSHSPAHSLSDGLELLLRLSLNSHVQETAMLAEIFMLRLEATARAANEVETTTSSRFVPITLPDAKASLSGGLIATVSPQAGPSKASEHRPLVQPHIDVALGIDGAIDRPQARKFALDAA